MRFPVRKWMTSLPNLHNGFFDGLWFSPDKGARLFVRTVSGERSRNVLTEVRPCTSAASSAGIILSFALTAAEKLTVGDIGQLPDLKDDQAEMASRLLARRFKTPCGHIGGVPSIGMVEASAGRPREPKCIRNIYLAFFQSPPPSKVNGRSECTSYPGRNARWFSFPTQNEAASASSHNCRRARRWLT